MAPTLSVAAAIARAGAARGAAEMETDMFRIANVHNESWDVSHLPNFHNPQKIDVIEPANLTRKIFNRYVYYNRPLYIPGLISSWPALKLWPSHDYLKTRCGAESEVLYNYHPLVENQLEGPMPVTKSIKFGEFLDKTAASGNGYMCLHNQSLTPAGKENHWGPDLFFGALAKDLGTLDFVTLKNTLGIYPIWTLFMGRNTMTDFHYHPATEAIMCQVRGTRELVMYPPTREAWPAMYSRTLERSHVYDVDFNRFPEFAAVRPYRVRVSDGDGVYIPNYWWHAAASALDEFGITISCFWDAPLSSAFDARFPATFHTLKLAASKLPWHRMAALYPAAALGMAFALPKLLESRSE